MWLKYLTIPLLTPISVRVGRELNPLGGRPDPRVKSPMLYLAELPTRLSPSNLRYYTPFFNRRFGRYPDALGGTFDPPNRDKRDWRDEPRGELQKLTER